MESGEVQAAVNDGQRWGADAERWTVILLLVSSIGFTWRVEPLQIPRRSLVKACKGHQDR